LTLFMLDTNILSDMIRQPAGTIATHIARVGEGNICLSIITAVELRFGAAKSGSDRLSARGDAELARIRVLPLAVPADVEYGSIRRDLSATGRPIGPNDLLIAAHARASGATLVTANTNEFCRVQGLAVENWTAPSTTSATG
jgi:tRNA(fMet)-specific endonuclease VapC